MIGKAYLLHRWFARRMPEAVAKEFRWIEESLPEQSGPRIVLDPFMGSGALLAEAASRGHSVVGLDVNPVAWLIARQTLVPPNPELMRKYLSQLDEGVGQTIRGLYSSRDPTGQPVETVTAFHSRLVRCVCGSEVGLHHSYLLARSRTRGWSMVLCPQCGEVFSISAEQSTAACPACSLRYDWATGTVQRGFLVCPYCRQKTRLVDLPSITEAPVHRLVAIESFEPTSGRRSFHRPSEIDFQHEQEAISLLPKVRAHRLLETPIPTTGRTDPRPITYGFRYYGQLFRGRQLYSLGLLSDAIATVDNEDAGMGLALVLSNVAGSNNLLCRYAADWLKLTPAFALHGFHPLARPVEGNVWGAGRGRGSFRNLLLRAAEAYSALSEKIGSRVPGGTSFGQVQVHCADAKQIHRLQVPKVDLVFTDPPYFDNLDYSDLADFYYQWLRLALRDHPHFLRSHVQNDADLSRIASGASAESQFGTELGEVFAKLKLALRPDGIVAFTYHHREIHAWRALLVALRYSELVVGSLRFTQSERENGFHTSEGSIKIDAMFVASFDRRQVPAACWLNDAISDLGQLGRPLRRVELEAASLACATAALSAECDGRDDALTERALYYRDLLESGLTRHKCG